jgi:WD40 repeat protein
MLPNGTLAGLLEIRSGLELEVVQCGGVWRLDCNGFNDLVRAHKCMWAAANNGAVFVFDLVTHSLLRQLEVHVDSVRALCYIPDDNDQCEFVTSGSGRVVPMS